MIITDQRNRPRHQPKADPGRPFCFFVSLPDFRAENLHPLPRGLWGLMRGRAYEIQEGAVVAHEWTLWKQKKGLSYGAG